MSLITHCQIKLIILLCLLWLAVTAIISTLGYYEYPRNGSHLMIIVTVLIPASFYLTWYAISPKLRAWNQQLDLAILTLPHSWRTVGYTFLTLWAFQILPAGFAAPAGMGDFAVAMSAPFVAIALWYQWPKAVTTAFWFHIVGIIDFFFALLTGITGFGALPLEMTQIDPMTTFPLVIIPTAFVPLLLLSHVMALLKINRTISKDNRAY